MWNSISKLWVTGVLDDSMSVKLLEVLELKDKKGLEGKKMVPNLLS